jgi:hypothetical protein
MEDIFTRRAIALSFQGVAEGGGPFGAVVVRVLTAPCRQRHLLPREALAAFQAWAAKPGKVPY